jgi:hypothetical protein
MLDKASKLKRGEGKEKKIKEKKKFQRHLASRTFPTPPPRFGKAYKERRQ